MDCQQVCPLEQQLKDLRKVCERIVNMFSWFEQDICGNFMFARQDIIDDLREIKFPSESNNPLNPTSEASAG